MTPVYEIQSEILTLLNEWKDFVWSIDAPALLTRKGKFFKEERSEYATSIECLKSMDHESHDGFPPDSHGYDFNQMATWIKDGHVKDLDLGQKILEKSHWLDNELGGILGTRFCALKMWYPKDGYIAWHNNWNVPGYNILFTYTPNGNGFWRNINPSGSTGAINTPIEDNLVHIPDVPGWHMKTGYYGKKTEPEKIMWHSAYSGEPRLTLGYVIFEEKLWKMMIEEIVGENLVWPLAPFDPSMLPTHGYAKGDNFKTPDDLDMS